MINRDVVVFSIKYIMLHTNLIIYVLYLYNLNKITDVKYESL